jgi:hypothetical protein
MQFSDLFAKLFSGGPKGLSGEADSVLPGDPDLAFFNEGLRRAKVDGDPRRRSGAHLVRRQVRKGALRRTSKRSARAMVSPASRTCWSS